MIIDGIGYLAGILTSLSFLPQVIRSYKTRSVEDISLLMLISMLIGTLFWLVYGILISALPIIVINAFFAAIVGFQLALKMKYSKSSISKG